MSESGAHAIGFGAALAEQFRWFWRRLWLWILIVPVLTSGVSAWIIASLPEEARSLAFLIIGNAVHVLLVLIAVSWSFSVWRDDPPRDRQYFWLHPVERTSHTIARSLAGFIWLLLVVAVIIAVVLITMKLAHGADAVMGTPRFWLYMVGAIALAYVAASIAPVLSDKPGLWLVAVIAIVILAGAIANIRDIEWLKDVVAWFQGGPRSFGAALSGPGAEAARIISDSLTPEEQAQVGGLAQAAVAQPDTALLIWLPIAIGAYLLACLQSRPR